VPASRAGSVTPNNKRNAFVGENRERRERKQERQERKQGKGTGSRKRGALLGKQNGLPSQQQLSAPGISLMENKKYERVAIGKIRYDY
jgi:hypothetical protein